ncbi:Yos1-like protein, partial [Prunus dulcis]
LTHLDKYLHIREVRSLLFLPCSSATSLLLSPSLCKIYRVFIYWNQTYTWSILNRQIKSYQRILTRLGLVLKPSIVSSRQGGGFQPRNDWFSSNRFNYVKFMSFSFDQFLTLNVYPSYPVQDLHSFGTKMFPLLSFFTGFATLIQGFLLLANAFAVLNEDRFLDPRGGPCYKFKEEEPRSRERS